MTQKDIQELKNLTKLFDNNDINYWLDSGTLLGIIRDGELPEGDSDIDISIWESDTSKVNTLLPQMCGESRTLTDLWKYSGKICRYQIRSSDDSLRKFDIGVYLENENFAWTPVKREFAVQVSQTRLNPGYWISKLLVSYINTLYKHSTVIDFTKDPYDKYINLSTYWIPRNFFDDFILDDEFGFRVPAKFKNYLEFRFGDWNSPVEDWDYLEDDRSIEHLPPDILVNQ